MASRQRRRFLAVVLFLVISALLVGLGVVVGSRLQSPEQLAALAEPPPPSPVQVEVEERLLESVVVLRASLTEVEAEGVSLPMGGGAVVTSVAKRGGETVRPGDLLLTVEGRPRIALQGDFPFYRDLVSGDEGPDVLQLEEALVELGYLEAADGEFDHGTQHALSALYDSVGFKPPGETVRQVSASKDELVVFPVLPVELTEVALEVGDDLTAVPGPHLITSSDVTLLEAETADTQVVGVLDQGMRLVAVDDLRGVDFEVEVASVETASESFRITFLVVGEAPDLAVGRSFRVEVPVATTGGPVTAVPVIALFTGPDGSTFVSTPRGDVEVRVGLVVDGWAEVEAVDGSLKPGDLVTVSSLVGDGS